MDAAEAPLGARGRVTVALLAGGLLLVTAFDSVMASVLVTFVALALAAPIRCWASEAGSPREGAELRRSHVYRVEPSPSDRRMADTSDGLLVVDCAGRIARTNAALRDLLRLSGPLLGQPAIHALNHAALHDVLDKARRQKGAAEEEIGLRARRLLVRAEPARDPTGPLLVTFRDVT